MISACLQTQLAAKSIPLQVFASHVKWQELSLTLESAAHRVRSIAEELDSVSQFKLPQMPSELLKGLPASSSTQLSILAYDAILDSGPILSRE